MATKPKHNPVPPPPAALDLKAVPGGTKVLVYGHDYEWWRHAVYFYEATVGDVNPVGRVAAAALFRGREMKDRWSYTTVAMQDGLAYLKRVLSWYDEHPRYKEMVLPDEDPT